MPLEPSNPNMLPEDLNPNFPGGQDNLDFGDNHIRLIKLALTNAQIQLNQWKLGNDSLFTEDGYVKVAVRALEADKLSGEIDLSQYAEQNGDYEKLRAQGTVKQDVGLSRIRNYPLSVGFDVNNRQSDRYLSLHTLKAFNQQVLDDYNSLLENSIPYDELVEVTGTYPELRAKYTRVYDIFSEFDAEDFVDSSWYETTSYPNYGLRTLVTPAYAKKTLESVITSLPRVQYSFMFLHYLPMQTLDLTGLASTASLTFKLGTITLDIGDNDIGNSNMLTCPDLYVEIDADPGYDFTLRFSVGFYTMMEAKFVDGGLNAGVGGGNLLLETSRFFDPGDTYDLNLQASGTCNGTIKVTYGQPNAPQTRGVWKLNRNAYIGRS